MTQEPSFEEARQELERIVAQLESGQASLEDSVALWERGEELYRVCVAKLDAAQGKIEELGRRAGEVRPPGETSDAAERPNGAPPPAG
jgi:exodeoxyribonuclease VII small subunit